MKTHLQTLLNAFFAGLFIGIAGTVYLATPNALLGPFLFAFGLLVIICYQFKLFTGAVGYWANQRGNAIAAYTLHLGEIWLGNLAGCALVGNLIRGTRTYPAFAQRVSGMCDVKLADAPASILILAVFCGILMYVAVETFKHQELPGVTRTVMVFLCVSVFILSGFEHSIAGMYYFSVAGMWSWEALACIGVMTAGNAIGGMLIPFGDMFRK